MKKQPILIILLILFLAIAGIIIYQRMFMTFKVNDEQPVATENVVTSENAGLAEGDGEMTYKQITMRDAKQIFESESDSSYIILDVRRPDEFANGHIPGAINVANENIGSEAPAELPDKNQIIYVYCRSGHRSKIAAKKLVDLGYTNIIEFGGIIDWAGAIEK